VDQPRRKASICVIEGFVGAPFSEGQCAFAARIDLRALAGWQEAAKGRREKGKLITVWRSMTPSDPSPDWRQPNS
jgi:hypothetical protein